MLRNQYTVEISGIKYILNSKQQAEEFVEAMQDKVAPNSLKVQVYPKEPDSCTCGRTATIPSHDMCDVCIEEMNEYYNKE